MQLTETTLTDWAEKHGIENLTEEAAAEFMEIVISALSKDNAKLADLMFAEPINDFVNENFDERMIAASNEGRMDFDKNFLIVGVNGEIENDNTTRLTEQSELKTKPCKK